MVMFMFFFFFLYFLGGGVGILKSQGKLAKAT